MAFVTFAGIMVLGGLVHGTLGLGFPLVTTPLLALAMDVRSAILITLLPTISVNVISVYRGGGWSESIGKFWPLAGYALFGSILGTHVLVVSDPRPFKILLATLVLLYLFADHIKVFRMTWVKTYAGLSMLTFGLLAGLAAGTTNVMVPILIIYALELELTRAATVQIFNLCFMAGKLSQIAVFAGAGLLSAKLLLSTAPLAATAIAALLVGMTLRERIPTGSYRRVVRYVLFILALLLLLQFLFDA